jgi:cell division transport system permease protein
MFTFLKRIIHYGWLNFQRQGSLSFATLFILVITLSLISWLFLSYETFQFLILKLQEKADISVYFKKEVLVDDILKLKSEISKRPEIKEVKYISKEKALEKFTEKHKENPILMESLKELGINPFLDSLNIKVFEFSQFEKISNFLENSHFKDLIEEIDYHQRKPIIEKIFSISSITNKIGISLILIFSLIAFLITFNTIRLAIYNSKEEISIMRLVGASNWFIRGPFLIQGIISAVLATLISIFLTFLICYFLAPKLEILFSGLNIFSYFTKNFWILISIQFAIAIALETISSLVATRKYLKI